MMAKITSKQYQELKDAYDLDEQLALFDVPEQPPNQADNQKRNWENGFQRWSNEAAQDETNPLGVCGFGSMCDYCEDNTYGRPCVRALNEMCREKRIFIDYSARNYEDIWNGRFGDGK